MPRSTSTGTGDHRSRHRAFCPQQGPNGAFRLERPSSSSIPRRDRNLERPSSCFLAARFWCDQVRIFLYSGLYVPWERRARR